MIRLSPSQARETARWLRKVYVPVNSPDAEGLVQFILWLEHKAAEEDTAQP